ncbi:MAG: hypothetical protein IJ639_04060 [Ruminococcus sp.]|nr:hypothetical protein [Ruminococcus sp.]
MKKGLALIYNPHNLLEFVWYCCTYSKDTEWDALCLPSGHMGEYMSEYCEKSGLFNKIYASDKNYSQAGMKEQLGAFLSMFGHYITGRRAAYCKKTLNRYVEDIDRYDELVVLNDIGLVGGLMIGLGKQKDVIILEDGVGDYVEKSNKRFLKHLLSGREWRGFLLAKMGYSNSEHNYPLVTSKYCTKFNSKPEKMKYRKYKRFEKLFDFTDTDVERYNRIIADLYTDIDQEKIRQSDAIVFTTNVADFTKDPGAHIKAFEDYMNAHANAVMIKKHPRDCGDYVFDPAVSIYELSPAYPAEVILPYIKDKQIYFMFPSSVLLYVDDSSDKYHCFYFEKLYAECQGQESFLDYPDRNRYSELLRLMGAEDIDIITL